MGAKQGGRLISIRSYDHAQDQIRDHAVWVLRQLGFPCRKLSNYWGQFPRPEDLEYDCEEALDSIDIIEEFWIRKYLYWKEHIRQSLELGHYIFLEPSVPLQAAEAAIDWELDPRKAFDYANSFCQQCYNNGIRKVDLGVVITDPRLDRIFHQMSGAFYLRTLPEKYLQQRDIFLSLVSGEPGWSVVTSGLADLATKDGLPLRVENADLWRPYDDVEMETIRHILPPDYWLADSDLRKLVEQATFQKVD